MRPFTGRENTSWRYDDAVFHAAAEATQCRPHEQAAPFWGR